MELQRTIQDTYAYRSSIQNMRMSIRDLITETVYEAEIQYICKKMAGGGCVIRTNCLLSFTTDKVEVSYHTEVRCTPKEREANYADRPDKPAASYAWSESNGIITIKGFAEYGTFQYKKDQLIPEANSEEKEIIFIKK